ncbi:TonB-dependent siderophore receptor [Variovorax sp. KBW07]|uniref:TonB-dependent siderophore receptor n=1 Tax=Variovorax sp. KBW07 TaxID=2153358 RepID=UPI000F56E5B9|nr:TonB-dependent receptor [Variovorax sp. KBW07]RQO61586.1 TonB-dependent siderophore receptor [Variovorax sp. KBW07]
MAFIARPGRRFRPSPSAALARAGCLAAALGAAAAGIGPAWAQTAPAVQPTGPSRPYAIAAGSLDSVLGRFGREANVMIAIDPTLTQGLESPGLQGSFSVPEGLGRLLAGSGLEALPGASGGWRLRKATGTAAGAQAPTPQGAEAATGPALAPVIVSARRERLYDVQDVNAGALGIRSLQDLPFAVGSYTVDTIEAQRARTALDVLRNDPSVTPTSGFSSFDGVAVRGFSANSFNNVRRDGLLANVYSDVPLENKERVDVLKGLSGFLYGVGEPSGIVNYVVKRPTRERFASVTAEVRSYGGRYAAVDAGGPLNEGGTVGYRFNAATEKVGDFTHFGDLKRDFLSGAVDIKINRDALLQLDFDWQKKSLAASGMIGPRSDGTVLAASRFDPRTLVGQPWGQYKTDAWNIGARLDYALNSNWDLTAQLGFSRSKRNALFFNASQIAPNGDVLKGNTRYEAEPYPTAAGQVFTTGRFKTGTVGHEAVIGYSYSSLQSPDGDYQRFPQLIGNVFRPLPYLQPYLSDNTHLPASTARQSSVFVSDTLSFTPQWQLLVGARHISYASDIGSKYDGTPKYTTRVTVPTLSAMYKPSERTTVYATYGEGFEQGAYAPSYAENALQKLGPIKSRQYEIGVKSRVLDGLMVTAAAFDMDKPLQAVTPSDNIFRQQGRQRHRGVEFTANGEITPQLSGIAGVSWLDAEQRDTGDATLEGRRPSNVARFQANVFLDYRLTSVPGLSFNTGIYHVGNRPLDRANTMIVPGFTRWDLGAAYVTKLMGKSSVIRLSIENVANRRYWSSVNYGGVTQGNPRIVRLATTVNF